MNKQLSEEITRIADVNPRKCMKCGKIFCMESQHVPELNLPEGFSLYSVNFVAKGLCDRCAAAHSQRQFHTTETK